MKISIELGNLIHCLICSGINLRPCDSYDPALKIHGIERFLGQYSRSGNRTIYLCSGTDRPGSSRCIIFTSEFLPEDKTLQNVVFLIPNDLPQEELYLRIIESLMEYLSWDAAMERLISETSTIQQLVSISEAYFPFPLMIFNVMGKLMAQTESVASDYAPFREIAEKKHMLFDVISNMGILDTPTSHAGQARGSFIASAKRNNAINIYRNCYLLGHTVYRCCIFCNLESPTTEFQWFAESFFRRVDRYIDRNKDLFRADAENDACLLRTLIGGTYADKDFLTQNLAYHKIPLQGKFFLVNFLLPNIDHQQKDLLMQKVRALGDVKCFLYNNGVIALLNLNRTNQRSRDSMAYYMEQIDALLDEYQTTAAVSNAFEEIFSIFGAYIQTEKTLELMQRLNPIAPRSDFFRGKTRILHYKEVFSYHLLYDIGEWTINENCVAKDLLRYVSQSRLTQEEILKTLYVHISNGCRHNVTAQQLSLHRNTVANRMEQIEQELSISLDNFEDCINVILAIKAIECGYTQ